jgi:hypothetical protein
MFSYFKDRRSTDFNCNYKRKRNVLWLTLYISYGALYVIPCNDHFEFYIF